MIYRSQQSETPNTHSIDSYDKCKHVILEASQFFSCGDNHNPTRVCIGGSAVRNTTRCGCICTGVIWLWRDTDIQTPHNDVHTHTQRSRDSGTCVVTFTAHSFREGIHIYSPGNECKPPTLKDKIATTLQTLIGNAKGIEEKRREIQEYHLRVSCDILYLRTITSWWYNTHLQFVYNFASELQMSPASMTTYKSCIVRKVYWFAYVQFYIWCTVLRVCDKLVVQL